MLGFLISILRGEILYVPIKNKRESDSTATFVPVFYVHGFLG